MKRILFRADAKLSIGTGDLISLIHLSRYFEKNGWEAHFFVRNYDSAVHLLKSRGIKHAFIAEADAPIEKEVCAINGYVEDKKISAVFFEITERRLKEYAGLLKGVVKACVSFDGDIPPDMDLVVNWDVEAEKYFATSHYPKTNFLLGPEYSILPIDFDSKTINNRVFKTRPETLLITMGGYDEFNLVKRIAEVLIRNNIEIKVNIAVGAGYKYMEELKAALMPGGIKYEIKQDTVNMFEEYMRCDIAVASGGLTAFELLASRTPSLLIATYEHQIPRCAYLDKNGLAKYLGFRQFDENILLRHILNPPLITQKNVFKTDRIREIIDELAQRR